MNRRPTLLEMVRDGVVPIGMQSFTANAGLVEVMGAAGFDYVWLDTEHSPIDPRSLEDTMRACEVAGLLPLVRIPEPGDHTAARRALEAGAHAIIAPMVRSAADVRELVRALTYPPNGTRGLCPGLRVPGYSLTEFNDYMRESDENLLIIPMIETAEALANVDEIFAIKQVGATVFAMGELSFAMGEGPYSPLNPRIREAQEKVHAAARAHGIAVIGGDMFNTTVENYQRAMQDEIAILCVGIDVMSFRLMCEDIVGSVNRAVAAAPGKSRPTAKKSGFPR
ncbi:MULTISPECIES: HpcH/HpaI aldolase/citrate lyase family protein [unclassified Microbacterium]|uniref:HpcH/HpaI aldolase family protein n=1 Tax=unclassified Microbacterium TaxID=2609290 RepID=UPI003652B079